MKQSKLSYKYKFGLNRFFDLIYGPALILVSGFIVVRFDLDIVLNLLPILSGLFGLVQVLLFFNYLYQSLKQEISIDPENGQFTILNNLRTSEHEIQDITSIDLYKNAMIGSAWSSFNFARYHFSNGTDCIITTHMGDELYVPTGIRPKITKRLLPFVR